MVSLLRHRVILLALWFACCLPCIAQVQNGGFEATSNFWFITGHFPVFENADRARTGSYYAYTGTSANLQNPQQGTLYQNITIPSGLSSASLEFYLWVASDEDVSGNWDVLQLQILNSTGTVTHQAEAGYYSNRDKTSSLSATTKAYVKRTVSLNNYIGQTIRIQFKSTVGGGYNTIFRIDDVALVTTAALPNLTPHQPSGWSDKIVVSRTSGTNTDASELTTADSLFVDWSVTNNGAASVGSVFYSRLYLDGSLIGAWNTQPPMPVGSFTSVLDHSLGNLDARTHHLELIVDATNTVTESDESNADNRYTREFTVSPPPKANLVTYQPAGWSDRVVVSKVTGTNTSTSTATTQDDLFLDLAFLNQSSTPTGNGFHAQIKIDGIVTDTLSFPQQLAANETRQVLDQPLGRLTPGIHVISILLDSASEVVESEESVDNYYEVPITITGPTISVTSPTAGSYQAGAPIAISWALGGDTSQIDRLRIAILEGGVEVPGLNFRPPTGSTSYSWQPASTFTRSNLTARVQAFSSSGQVLATGVSAAFSTVTATSLQARITPPTGKAYLNRPVTFSAASSVAAPGRPITSYAWIFYIGNAQVATSASQSPAFTFAYGNEVRAELTVGDGFNTSGPVSLTVPLIGIGDPSKQQAGTSADPVNTATGNFVMSLSLLDVHARGLRFVFQAFYSSQAFEPGDINPGSLGYGWSHTLETRIFPVEFDNGVPTTRIVFGDGHQEKFHDDGVGWTAQPGNYNQLTQSADGLFTLKTPGQIRHRFDALGRLVSISDRNDNTLTIVWNNSPSRIIRVELPGGPDPLNPREVLFDYDPSSGHLAKLTDPIGRTVEFTVDANHDLTAYKNPRGFSTHYTYDALHQMLTGTNPRTHVFVRNVYQDRLAVEQFDADNNRTTFAYTFNPTGLSVTRVTRFAAGGNEITDDYHSLSHQLVERRVWLDGTRYLSNSSEYDPVTGDLTKTIDRNGNATTYQTTNGNRTRITTADRAETNITYTAFNDPEFTTLPNGTVKKDEYDTRGNHIASTFPFDAAHPSHYKRIFTVDAYGQQTGFTDANGNPTTTTMTSWGEAQIITDAEGFSETNEFDGISRPTASIDRRNNRTSYTLNEHGGVEVSTLPDPNGPTTIKQSFDANDNRISLENQLHYITRFEFDKQDRQVKTINSLLNSFGIGFDELGRLTSSEDAKHHFSHKVYDLASRLISAQDEAGRAHTFTHDANGNVLTDTDDDGVKIETVYDVMNRPIKVRRWTSATAHDETETHYDNIGQVDWIKNAKGQTTYLYYNAAGHLIRLVEPSVGGRPGQEFTWTYDFEGRLLTATHPYSAGPKTRFQTWTPRNQIATRTDENGKTERLYYNAANLIDHIINQENQRIDYLYDSLNRLIRVSPPTGPPTVFTYDAAGQRLTMDDELGRTTWSYTPLGQVETCTDPFNLTLGFGYDANGNRNRITYPGSKVANYTFDDANLMVSVSDWAGHSITRHFTGAGRISSIDYPGGVSTSIGHDAAGRESNVQHRIGTALPFIHFGYEFDELSVIKKIDKIAAPTLATQFPVTAATYTYDAANQLTCVDGITVTHDSRGNVLTGKLSPASTGTDTLGWDAFGQLRSYTIAGESGSHGYNGLGQRLQTTHAGSTRRFVVDGTAGLSQVMAETTGSGAITAYYLYLGGLAARVLPDGGISCYHSDRQGNVLALTDGAGSITDLYKYDEFGVLLGSSGTTANPFRYAGGFGVQTDTNGTLFSRARYYHADWGRFLSRDALFGSQQSGQSLNRYAAFLNDPFTFSDPSGFAAEHAISPDFYTDSFRTANSTPIYATSNGTFRFTVHDGLDLIGLIPLFGEPADVLNGLIYSYQGDHVNAALSYGGAIPVVGWVTTGGKWVRKAVKLPIWTPDPKKGLTEVQNALRHFNDHSAEFPEIMNAKQYVESANSFFSSPPSGTLTKVRSANGDRILYHPETNTFGVQNSNGVPKTLFKPSTDKHPYSTNLEYFHAQH